MPNYHQILHYLFLEASYPEVFLASFAYFVSIYFGVGNSFLWVCKRLEGRWLQKIVDREPSKNQIKMEIKHSLVSIFNFGLSGVLMAFCIRQGWVVLLPDSVLSVAIGVVLLNLWNEFHFFLIHRIMHFPFFFRRVHFIHHLSKTPTIYSVYSFHWVESFLLSTVLVTAAFFVPISITVLWLYPLTSLVLNLSGHSNYRFGNGEHHPLALFATRHNQHHSKGSKNYGFVLPVFDLLIKRWTK